MTEDGNMDQWKARDGRRESPLGVLGLIVLLFVANLAPFIILLLAAWLLLQFVPAIWFSDREFAYLMIPLGAFILTFVFLSNRDFWSGFFREFTRRDEPAVPNRRIH